MKKIKQKKYKFFHSDSGYKKNITLKVFELPNGKNFKSYISNEEDSVNIFPITKDRKVILVKVFRPGSEKVELEIPGGMVDPGEQIKVAAKRELLEETAYSGNLTYLGFRHYSPYSSGKRHLFIATDCVRTANELDLDSDEYLEVEIVSLKELEELLLSGKIRNADGVYMGLQRLGMLKFEL